MNELRILDVGCGPGLYVEALRAQGHDAIGIDPDPTLVPGAYLRRMSVFDPAYLKLFETQGFDLVMCLEVAEHIPFLLADDLVGLLCLPAPLVLFSAAQPGQGGDGHINLRPKGEWTRSFAEHGFLYDAAATDALVAHMRAGPHMGWFVNNAQVFRAYGTLNFATIQAEEQPQADRIAAYVPQLIAGLSSSRVGEPGA